MKFLKDASLNLDNLNNPWGIDPGFKGGLKNAKIIEDTKDKPKTKK